MGLGEGSYSQVELLSPKELDCFQHGTYKSHHGGSYMYHAENNQVLLGIVIPLDYKNPHLSPYDEFQKWKSHSGIRKYLKGGKRLSYGARALIKGGLQSLPSMDFPENPC